MKKRTFLRCLGALFACTALLGTACNKAASSGDANAVFTVTFDTDGGSAVAAQEVKNGEHATKPADPTKSGFTFDNWYADKAHVTLFDFEKIAITANWTVYANWNAGSEQQQGGEQQGGEQQGGEQQSGGEQQQGYALTVAIASDFAGTDEGKYGNGGAVTYIYAFNTSANEWLDAASGSVTIADTYTGFIVVRMNPTGAPSWDAKWNQTADITIEKSKSTVTITGWDDGNGKLAYTYA